MNRQAEFEGEITISDLEKEVLTLRDELSKAEDRLSEMMGNLPVILFRLEMARTGAFHLSYLNNAVAMFMGRERDEILKNPMHVFSYVVGRDRFRLLRRFKESRQHNQSVDEEICIKLADGEKKWVRIVANARAGDEGRFLWDGTAIDITGQRLLDERLRFLAYHDETTLLPNRLAMEEHLNALFNRSEKQTFALLALTIDRLDLVNDTLGQETANRLVVTVADKLGAHLRAGTFLAHPRPDSFCVILEELTDEEDVVGLAQCLLDALKIPFDVGTRRLDISVSMGISLAYKDGEDAESMMMNAETALRRAHRASPGGYRFYVEEMNTRALRVLAYENRLRKALQYHEFVPFFQPLINVSSGEIAAMEALVRWKHPRLGLVGPSEFIPVAEEAGLIGEICHQVLKETCETAKLWLDSGLPPVPLAVNISWRQFAQPERLIKLMNDILKMTGLPPEMIELELTESSVMEEPDSAIRTLNDLREFGVLASIDDFGTGYSSLSYLKRLPISKLKIDRAFIHEVTENDRDAAIVDAIIRLARALGLKTVAEGIETREQLDYLRQKGCDLAQGFYFSRPVPADEMEKLLLQGPFSVC